MRFESLTSTTSWDYPVGKVGQDWWPSRPTRRRSRDRCEPMSSFPHLVVLPQGSGKETWASRGQGPSGGFLKRECASLRLHLQGQGSGTEGGLGREHLVQGWGGLDKAGTRIWGWGQGSFLGEVLGPRSRLQTSARASAHSASFVEWEEYG